MTHELKLTVDITPPGIAEIAANMAEIARLNERNATLISAAKPTTSTAKAPDMATIGILIEALSAAGNRLKQEQHFVEEAARKLEYAEEARDESRRKANAAIDAIERAGGGSVALEAARSRVAEGRAADTWLIVKEIEQPGHFEKFTADVAAKVAILRGQPAEASACV